MLKIKGKKAIETEVLVWTIVGIIILILSIVGYIILTKKDLSLLEFIKNLFRFGG